MLTVDRGLEDDLSALAFRAASEAAVLLRDMQSVVGSIEPSRKESNYAIVTEADIAAEAVIVRILTGGPAATIITEETYPDVTFNDNLCWIVDPLDGSSAYYHGLDTFSVSIAAYVNRRPAVGIVWLPAIDQHACAVAGRGITGTFDAASVSSHELPNSMISVGASVVRNCFDGSSQHGVPEVLHDAQALRIGASCAQELLLVATGRVDAFYAANQRIWDYAAGILLVTEAGGRVHIGTDTGDGRRDILASNAVIDAASMMKPPVARWQGSL